MALLKCGACGATNGGDEAPYVAPLKRGGTNGTEVGEPTGAKSAAPPLDER